VKQGGVPLSQTEVRKILDTTLVSVTRILGPDAPHVL
jgi:hypothetical protein